MHGAAQIGDALRRNAFIDDQIGLIERLAAPQRDGHERQLRWVLDERKATDPGGIKLVRQQQRRNLLIRPSMDETDRVIEPTRQITFELRQKLDIRIQKDWREPEANWFIGSPDPMAQKKSGAHSAKHGPARHRSGRHPGDGPTARQWTHYPQAVFLPERGISVFFWRFRLAPIELADAAQEP